MKILLQDEDTGHILDLSLNPDNPIYEGCEVRPVQHSRSSGPANFELVGAQEGLSSIIYKNALAILRGMPADYIIITGVTTNWVRSHLHILASTAVSVVFTNDGKNTLLLPGPPPATRSQLAQPSKE